MDHSEHNMDHHAGHDHGHSMHDSHAGHGILSLTTTTTMSPADVIVPASHDHAHMHHAPAEQNNMMGGHMNHMNHMVNHMMSMSFHFGYEETILLDFWKINSIGGLIASMAGIFILAVLYEGLKYYREFLFWKTYNLLEYRPVTGPQANPESGQMPPAPSNPSPVQPTMFSLNHFIQTGLHMVQVTVSFLLMLIFMTYNVWLCLAVVVGAAVGYFLFCWKKSVIVDVTEHCH
ncbi:copper transporter 1A isoform X2 [Haematobia irritans]|uniref:copper transporter 1A isoform X2 n=1 Tax=Haematobia irritans TaxID=7368 RepID=UPI003F50ADE7